MERNEINLSFHCLDILKRIRIKLKVSAGMRCNLFHPIRFHSIIIFQIQTIEDFIYLFIYFYSYFDYFILWIDYFYFIEISY
jgi:hypothetical protein